MAQNRKRAKKLHYQSNLEDVKTELEEARQREKLQINRVEKQKQSLERQERKIMELEKAIDSLRQFDSIASNLLTDEAVQKVLLKAILKKGLGKELMDLCKP
jgi:ABC-type transport system involved in cytochrome bd biosynthesis fused ATPase/permease subunit